MPTYGKSQATLHLPQRGEPHLQQIQSWSHLTIRKLADTALSALLRASQASCSVCGSDYQKRFFGSEENGFHPRIRETKRSRAIGNTRRYCPAAGLNAERADLLKRLRLSPGWTPF